MINIFYLGIPGSLNYVKMVGNPVQQCVPILALGCSTGKNYSQMILLNASVFTEWNNNDYVWWEVSEFFSVIFEYSV